MVRAAHGFLQVEALFLAPSPPELPLARPAVEPAKPSAVPTPLRPASSAGETPPACLPAVRKSHSSAKQPLRKPMGSAAVSSFLPLVGGEKEEKKGKGLRGAEEGAPLLALAPPSFLGPSRCARPPPAHRSIGLGCSEEPGFRPLRPRLGAEPAAARRSEENPVGAGVCRNLLFSSPHNSYKGRGGAMKAKVPLCVDLGAPKAAITLALTCE